MKDLNKECVICGTKYSYCNRCGYDTNKPTWMNLFCCQECKDIYEACAGNIAGNYSDEETKVLLDMCDVKKVTEKPVLIKNVIKKLYKEEEKISEAKEDIVVEEKKVEQQPKQQVYNQNNYYKKNKRK